VTRFPSVQLRRVLRVINGGTPSSDAENWDGDVPWATPIDLAPVNGRALTETVRTITGTGLRTGSSAVRAGSLIVSTRAPIGYVAQVDRLTAFNQGCRGLVPVRPVDIRYFRYQLVAAGPTMQSRGQGSTFIELSTEAFASMPIHLPILASQSTIADYLDRETAQIDAMVDRKKHMVSLLNEALTSAALALVSPETFQGTVLPFRRIAEKLSRDCVSDGVVTAFRDGHVMLRSRRREDGFTESDTQAGYQGVIAGDVVFHGLDGFAGAIGVAEDAGICSPVYHVCRIRDGFDATYVGLVLRSMALAGHLQLQAGNVRERAVDFRNWDTLARMVLPVPPLNTQRMLASARTGRRVGTEALTAALDRQIAILRERRHALITAAVTGELGIPEVAA